MADAGDAAQMVELFAPEIKADLLDGGHAAGKQKLVDAKRMVPSPVTTEFHKEGQGLDADLLSDGIFRIEETSGAAHRWLVAKSVI